MEDIIIEETTEETPEMEMPEMPGTFSHVYIKIDSANHIIQIEGEYTLSNLGDMSDAILIEEGVPCDRLNLAQTHYLDKTLTDEQGCHNYIYENEEIREATEEEKQAEIVVPDYTPTLEERVAETEVAICEIAEMIVEMMEG